MAKAEPMEITLAEGAHVDIPAPLQTMRVYDTDGVFDTCRVMVEIYPGVYGEQVARQLHKLFLTDAKDDCWNTRHIVTEYMKHMKQGFETIEVRSGYYNHEAQRWEFFLAGPDMMSNAIGQTYPRIAALPTVRQSPELHDTFRKWVAEFLADLEHAAQKEDTPVAEEEPEDIE